MPKVGRPKHIRPHEAKLQLPKHVLKYKAKRLYWALLEIEKKMSKDITSVRMSEYTAILNAYTDVCDQLSKEGIVYGGKTKQRMDASGNAQGDTERGGTSGVGENGSADMVSGVRAVNPIT